MRFFILICLLSCFGCQSSWRIKPENFAREVDKHERYGLKKKYENDKGLVVIFWQSTCPCVKRYEARVKKLYETYSPQGLSFVYMSSNSNESFAHAQKAYAKRHMPLELIRDEGGIFAHRVEAKGTPAALLINKQGDVVYMGWIDNERREGEKQRVAYLENAIKEYLSGQAISVKTSPMFGCAIY